MSGMFPTDSFYKRAITENYDDSNVLIKMAGAYSKTISIYFSSSGSFRCNPSVSR